MLEIATARGGHLYRFRFAEAGHPIPDLSIPLGPPPARLPAQDALAIRRKELESSVDGALRARVLPESLRLELMKKVRSAIDSAAAAGSLLPRSAGPPSGSDR